MESTALEPAESSPSEPADDIPPTLSGDELDALLGTLTGGDSKSVGPEATLLVAESNADESAAPRPEVAQRTEETEQPDPEEGAEVAVSLAADSTVATGPETEKSEPDGATQPASPAPKPKVPTFAGFELLPAERQVAPDGVLTLDGKYAVRGQGTEADPYRVSWDLLTSASETLAPRQGRKKLPERVTMLDGKWVEVSGYVAFPLMAQEADELLLMLNQWDGCCIGVPPTPYDAVEVSLSQPARGQDRFAVQGTLKGVLGVKPHLVGEWLVGVYVMDRATLSTREIGGLPQ